MEKNIKKKEILHDVCAEFLGEHIYGIVGPNASGKTMLLRAIAGFLYLDGVRNITGVRGEQFKTLVSIVSTI